MTKTAADQFDEFERWIWDLYAEAKKHNDGLTEFNCAREKAGLPVIPNLPPTSDIATEVIYRKVADKIFDIRGKESAAFKKRGGANMTDDQKEVVKTMNELITINKEKIKTMKELDSTLKQMLHHMRVSK